MKKRLLLTLFLSGGLVLTSCGGSTASNITAVKLNRSYISLAPNETFLLEATTIGGEKEVTFFSSDSSIASIDATGLVTAIASGETSVYAIANDKIATCLVKVENNENEIRSAIKKGTISMKIDSSFFEKTGQVFYAPLTYTYQSRGGAFDDENSKMHFDVEWTKGIASTSYTAVEQSARNVEFINYLFNYDNNSLSSLFSSKKSWEERAMAYSFNRKEDTKNYGEDHFTVAMLNDRLYADSYAVIDENIYPRAAKEIVYEDNEMIELITSLIQTIRMLDLSKLSLSQIDLVTILKNMYPDPATILDENTNTNIQTISRVLAVMLFALSGYTNIDYKPVNVKGYDGINLHFYLNDLGKQNLSSLSSLLSFLGQDNEEVKKVLDEFAINDFALDLTLYSDPTYKNYNHCSSVSFLLDLNLPENNTLKFDTTLDFGVDTIYEKASYISSLYDKHNMNKAIQKEADDYIALIGDVISYNDKDNDSKDFSLLKDKLAQAREALNNFSSLSTKAKFMLVEERFNAKEIENLYAKGELALTLTKAAMALISENSTINGVNLAIQTVRPYKDFKLAIEEANKEKFDIMVNIVKNYLLKVKEEISEAALGLRDASNKEIATEVIDAALAYESIFDTTGDVFNLIPRYVLGIRIDPTYGDDVMLTDELISLRDEVIFTEEIKDEDGNLENNLYAVTYYTKEAFKKAIELIISSNNGEDLYNAISYKDNEGNDTKLAKFASMAKKDFSVSIIPQQVALNNLLSVQDSTTLATTLREKVGSIKDEIYETLIDYKRGSITKELAKEKLDTIELNLSNIESIQNDLLDALQRVNLSTIRSILDDVKNLIN